MSSQLGCRVHFYAHPQTLGYIRGYIQKKHKDTRVAYSELEDWDDLLLLTGQVNYDHLLVIISARRGSISYDSAFERLPMQISKYFNNNSIMLLYPEQKGDPNESLSFSDPRGWAETQYYDKVGNWFYKWFKKEFMSEDSKAWQQRTELLLGKDKTDRLRQAHVLVVGLGGVGAYAAEMICRAGVGRMTIVDADTVQPSNINRQLPATHSSLGKQKAEVLAERFLDINPELNLRYCQCI